MENYTKVAKYENYSKPYEHSNPDKPDRSDKVLDRSTDKSVRASVKAAELTSTVRNGSGYHTEMLNECVEVSLKGDTGANISVISVTYVEELTKKGHYLSTMVLDPPLNLQLAVQ